MLQIRSEPVGRGTCCQQILFSLYIPLHNKELDYFLLPGVHLICYKISACGTLVFPTRPVL